MRQDDTFVMEEKNMKNEDLTKRALDFLSEMYELIPETEYMDVRRIILLASSDITNNKQSVQFVINKFYNSVYKLAFHKHVTLPKEFLTILSEAQKLTFKNGLSYASGDMRMALYE